MLKNEYQNRLDVNKIEQNMMRMLVMKMDQKLNESNETVEKLTDIVQKIINISAGTLLPH